MSTCWTAARCWETHLFSDAFSETAGHFRFSPCRWLTCWTAARCLGTHLFWHDFQASGHAFRCGEYSEYFLFWSLVRFNCALIRWVTTSAVFGVELNFEGLEPYHDYCIGLWMHLSVWTVDNLAHGLTNLDLAMFPFPWQVRSWTSSSAPNPDPWHRPCGTQWQVQVFLF